MRRSANRSQFVRLTWRRLAGRRICSLSYAKLERFHTVVRGGGGAVTQFVRLTWRRLAGRRICSLSYAKLGRFHTVIRGGGGGHTVCTTHLAADWQVGAFVHYHTRNWGGSTRLYGGGGRSHSLYDSPGGRLAGCTGGGGGRSHSLYDSPGGRLAGRRICSLPYATMRRFHTVVRGGGGAVTQFVLLTWRPTGR